jgi:subtilisin family serine protease
MRAFQGAFRNAVLVFAFLLPWLTTSAAAAPEIMGGEVIVKFKPGASQAAIDAILADLHAVPIRRFGRIQVEHDRISGGLTVPQAIARYRNHPAVQFIEPNYIVSIVRTPNDPLFPQLWGLNNTGQTGGLPGADISATEAWETTTGTTDVVVGIIDTGIDYTHPDLAANIYTNPGEIPGNNIDDDANGFVDDVRGWDFINHDNDPMDDHGHGTHVAGTVGAVGNNGVGVAGVNWTVRLMPLKFLSSGGSGTTADAISAIEYATQAGVNVMSNSWGGGGFSEALRLAIQDANAAGILFVAAAGNESNNNDLFPAYPASYDVPNVIAVAATNHNDQIANFSNFGATSVDLAAPGVDILSTLPGGNYGQFSGTSMATPHVSGALALLLSRFPGMTVAAAKALVINSVDQLPSLNGLVLSGGRLNVARALEGPDSIPPGPVLDLAALTPNSNSVPLQWTASGEDGPTGIVSGYEIRYATFVITEDNFDTATRSTARPEPHPPGSQEQALVAGLDFSTTYYFALRALDEYGNQSPISNVASATTLGPPDIDVSPTTLSAALLTGGTATRTLTLRNLAEGTLDFTLDVITTPGGGPGPGDPPPDSSLARAARSLPWSDYAHTPPAIPLYPAGPAMIATLPDVITDPSGDGGPVDLTVLRGLGHNGVLQIEMALSTVINRSNFGGFLSLDIDRNRATGAPPSFGNGAQDIGAEYEFQFFNLNSNVVDLFNVLNGGFVGSFPVEVGSRTLRFSVPLDVLGHDDGTMDVTGVIGDAFGPTDWFPNAGHGSILGIQWLSVTPDAGTVPPGGSVDVQVTFDASGLFGGAYDASIQVASNDPDEAEVPVAAHLDVTGAPDIALSSTSLDYGTVFLGVSRQQTVMVSNVGTDLLTVTGVAATPGDYSVDPGVFNLAPGDSHAVVVTFSPLSVAPIDGSLTITSNDHDEGVLTVALHGIGVIAPDIGVTPTSFASSLTTGETETRVLTVSNTGGSDLTFGVHAVRAPDTEPLGAPVSVPSSLRDPTWNQTHPTIPPPSIRTDYIGTFLRFGITDFGEIMPFQSPIGNEHLAVGSFLDGYTVAYFSGGADHVYYTVYGNRIGIVPVSYQELENTPTRVVVEVVTRTVDGVLGIRRVFTFVRAKKHVLVATEVRNLSPNPTLQVVFKEDTDWDMDGDFEDDSWAYDRPRNMVYAWDQNYGAVASEISPDVMDIYGWNDYTERATIIDVPRGPVDSFDGLEVLHFELGTLEAGQMRPVKLAYAVGASLEELQRSMDEAVGVPWLSVEPSAGIVPAGGSADLAVTFDPGLLPTGDYAGQVVVESNDPDEPDVPVPASLHITGVPHLTVSPASLDFGTPFVGQVVTRTLQFQNLGTGRVEVTGIAAGLPDYAVSPTSFALEQLQGVTVRVTFSPTAAGILNSTLTINSNDPGAPASIPLFGASLLPPVLTVSPPSIHAVLDPNQTRSEVVTIGNVGASDLLFTLRTSVGAAAVNVNSHPPFAKGEVDPRVGDPVTLGTGGPDAFGYTWVDNDTPGGPTFQWADISSIGISIPISGDDQTSGPIPIGFPFSFYGNTFTSFHVCTNGFLSFTSGSADYSNQPLPSVFAPENMVAAFWDDLFFSSGSHAYYYNDGTRMIVQYDTVFHLSGGGPYTFEIILYPSGEIVYQYLSMGIPVSNSTVGIQNGTRDDGLTAVFNNNFVHDNLAVRFAAFPSWLTVSPTSGTVSPGATQPLDALIDARGLPSGDYAATISLTTNDPATPLRAVPVTMHIVGIPVISVRPASLIFDPLMVGEAATQPLVVENIGTDSLIVAGISSDEGSYSAAPTTFTLAPHASQVVAVTFAPTSVGSKTGTLSITHNAAGSPTAVSLTGTAITPPILTYSPESIHVSLNPGAVRTEVITIGNTGGGDLRFSLEARAIGAAATVSTDPPLAKGVEDTRVGPPAVLRTGGPDGFGHKWIDSDSPGGPVFSWVNLATVGTTVPIMGDDIVSAPIPIGFPFRYFGAEYSSVRVCSNGYLTFTSTLPPAFSNQPLPSTAAPENLLAVFWDDLSLDAFSHVLYYYDGSRFVLEFENVHRVGGGGPYTFEVILYPSGTIVYQYLTMSAPLTSATIGLQNVTQDDGLTVVFDNNYVHGNLAIRFATGLSWLTLNPAEGSVPPGSESTVRAFLNTTGLAVGDYLGAIGLYTNDPAGPIRTIPLTLHVNGDNPPVVSAPATAGSAEGAPLVVAITASDPEGDPLYALTTGPLPPGGTFVPNDTYTAGELRWTPDFDQAGTYAVTISATSARHAHPVSGPIDPLEGSATIDITVANTDRAPVVTAPAARTVAEGVLLTFVVSAADPDGDSVDGPVVGEVPLGATYTPDPTLPQGTFAWTPTYESSGSYNVTFTASNALSGSATTSITVTNQNRAPIADAGGPYVGMAEVPITFDGSKSSDPDGQPLQFTWSFGDGDVGSGATPSHTYASMVGSPFTVTLSVSDGALSGTATTTATVQGIFTANVFLEKKQNFVFPQVQNAFVRVEPIDRSFNVDEVVVPSISMRYGGLSILTECKSTLDGDRNHNGIDELKICFSKDDLQTLFASLPNGTSTVSVTVEGDLVSGGKFRGETAIKVVKHAFLSAGLLAGVSPNPLNPSAVLTFVTLESGMANAQLFDLHGRLVRDLLPRQYFEPGAHQVTLDGRNDGGERLASGVYYYRVQSVSGTSKGAVTILK